METKFRHSAISDCKLRILLADSHPVSSNDSDQSAHSAAGTGDVLSRKSTSAGEESALSRKSAVAKKESALSRALTAAALEIFLGRKPSQEELSGELHVPGEKPCFPAYPDFYYNISHSDGIAVCGISDHPIGIDLQKIPEDTRRILRIANRFFSAKEQESLQALQDTNDPAAMCRLFCRYWTARESYIKLTGRGLAEPFENFWPDLDTGVVHTSQCSCTDSTGPFSEGTFYLTECPAPEGFCLTVCSTVPLPSCTPEETFSHS